MEFWLPVKNYPKYEVSNHGRVRNVNSGKVLKPFSNGVGYSVVSLYDTEKTYTTKKVHRLVADAFFDGDDHDELTVNHIDGDKTNNHLSNLEWCSQSKNIQHAYNTGLRKPPRMKKVKVIETGDIYESMSDCARSIGGSVSGIYDCIRGRQNTHRGYRFRFIDEDK